MEIICLPFLPPHMHSPTLAFCLAFAFPCCPSRRQTDIPSCHCGEFHSLTTICIFSFHFQLILWFGTDGTWQVDRRERLDSPLPALPTGGRQSSLPHLTTLPLTEAFCMALLHAVLRRGSRHPPAMPATPWPLRLACLPSMPQPLSPFPTSISYFHLPACVLGGGMVWDEGQGTWTLFSKFLDGRWEVGGAGS